jgi:hypothetical protein
VDVREAESAKLKYAANEIINNVRSNVNHRILLKASSAGIQSEHKEVSSSQDDESVGRL